MKENLFFRATKSNLKKGNCNSFFLKFILLPLLCISSFFNASVLEVQIPQQNQQAIIYVSGDAIIVENGSTSNTQIVKINSVPKESGSKKHFFSKINKKVVAGNDKVSTKYRAENLPKLFPTRFVFKSRGSVDSFYIGTFSNTKNSIITPAFQSGNLFSFRYVVSNIHIFEYLIKTYVADFSKIATLSRFLFSRPPPFC